MNPKNNILLSLYLKDRATYLDPHEYWSKYFQGQDPIHIKSGHVCPKCKKSVLAFKKPKNCREHE